jgi:hypothetical protein
MTEKLSNTRVLRLSAIVMEEALIANWLVCCIFQLGACNISYGWLSDKGFS